MKKSFVWGMQCSSERVDTGTQMTRSQFSDLAAQIIGQIGRIKRRLASICSISLWCYFLDLDIYLVACFERSV